MLATGRVSYWLLLNLKQPKVILERALSAQKQYHQHELEELEEPVELEELDHQVTWDRQLDQEHNQEHTIEVCPPA